MPLEVPIYKGSEFKDVGLPSAGFSVWGSM